ncbi:MAG: ABC transporter permease [Sphingomonas sp.]
MRWIRIALHHLRYINLSFWRNPSAAFFGVLFPLMLLTINSLVFGGGRIVINGETATVAAFYVAGMSVFAVVMICFTNLAISVLFDRDMGRLKRIRGTPTPVSAYVLARLTFAIGMGLVAALLCVADGVLFFGVSLPLVRLLAFMLTIAIGSASLAGLSLAVVSLVPNAQAGPAMLNAATFPVLFVSNVFYPIDKLPAWLSTLAGALPVRPLSQAAIGAFFGAGVSWDSLAVVLAWGAGGALVAAFTFRWQPKR